MKNQNFKIFALGILFILTSGDLSLAELGGRTQTKRERLLSGTSHGYAPVSNAAAEKKGYQGIHESFLSEQYANVDILANQYLSQNPNAADANDVLYLQALSLLKLNRSEEARQKLTQLEASARDPQVKAAASASIGDSYYYAGGHASAYDAYKETMKKYPSSDQKDYLRGRLMELSSEFGYTTLKNPMSSPPLASRLKQASFEEAGYYAVQVGSFSRFRNADDLAKKLVRQGYEAYVAAGKSHGLTRVRVGRYTSKTEAAKVEAKLKHEGYPTKIVP